jgi:hypothetical protein
LIKRVVIKEQLGFWGNAIENFGGIRVRAPNGGAVKQNPENLEEGCNRKKLEIISIMVLVFLSKLKWIH